MGKLLVLLGMVILAIGLLIWLGESQSWIRLGRLPGDINVQRGKYSFYFPLGTCLLISLLLSAVLYFFRR